MTVTRTTVKPEETRTLYVQKKGNSNNKVWYRLTIPSTAKVTFGPLLPGAQQDYGGRGNQQGSGLYLRVYRTKDHQLAVIPGVYQFRDSSVLWEVPTTDGFEATSEQHLLGSMAEQELQS